MFYNFAHVIVAVYFTRETAVDQRYVSNKAYKPSVSEF